MLAVEGFLALACVVAVGASELGSAVNATEPAEDDGSCTAETTGMDWWRFILGALFLNAFFLAVCCPDLPVQGDNGMTTAGDVPYGCCGLAYRARCM